MINKIHIIRVTETNASKFILLLDRVTEPHLSPMTTD